MALINRTLQLDITPEAIPKIVNVSEYDENRQFAVNLIDEGSVFTIPSGTTATVEGTIGNTGFSESATVSGDTITFTLSESMTAKAGDVWCKIKLTKDSKPIQTCAFILRCDRAGVEADTVIGMDGFEAQITAAVDDWLDENASALDGIVSANRDNLFRATDFAIEEAGVTFRSIQGKQAFYVDGTATNVRIINLTSGETAISSSAAATAWGSETLGWIESGKRYKLLWRLVSGSYTYTNSNPAFTVRTSGGTAVLSNAAGVTKLNSVPSYIQFFFSSGAVFNDCWFEVSVIETDTDELYEQSSASMALPGSVKVPALNALIADLSYTIPAEVTTTGNFVDTGGYAEGGCTDGNQTLYYVRHKGDTTTPTFVKATASGEVLATSSPSGVRFVHSNGMACNPTTGEVLVIPLDTSGDNAVHFLSANDLSHIRTINFGDSLREYAPAMTYFTAAAWDSTKQLYVFLMAGNSGYTNPVDSTAQKRMRGFAFYDADFNFVKCIRFDRLLTIPGYNDFNVSSTTFGGVYTDADYIYTTVHKTGGDVVAVFDWDGLLVGTFSAAFGRELEWMGRLGDGTWVFGYGSTVSGQTRVTVYKAVTTKRRQILKDTVRSQFKPFR